MAAWNGAARSNRSEARNSHPDGGRSLSSGSVPDKLTLPVQVVGVAVPEKSRL